jgi:hypothetical protein
MVFDVQGPRGSGRIHVETFLGEFITVILRKDGQEWDLREENPQPDADNKESMP